MPNPFSIKISAKQPDEPNPFAKKAKINIAKTTKDTKPTKKNPFANKASKPANNHKSNPFSSRIENERAQRIAQLDKMIAEAEQRYEESLTKAIKGGVNRKQITKLFNISDRNMSTLLSLTKQRRFLDGPR